MEPTHHLAPSAVAVVRGSSPTLAGLRKIGRSCKPTIGESSMAGTLESIGMPVLVLIMVVGLIVTYGGWGRGWKPPRSPFSD